MKVFVYWNLHKGMWSIKALEGPNKGRVIARLSEVLVQEATGKVSQAGRARVLREGRKNVHAGIVGWWVPVEGPVTRRIAEHLEYTGDAVTYNPFKYTSFVHAVDGEEFVGSPWALLTGGRKVYVA